MNLKHLYYLKEPVFSIVFIAAVIALTFFTIFAVSQIFANDEYDYAVNAIMDEVEAGNALFGKKSGSIYATISCNGKTFYIKAQGCASPDGMWPKRKTISRWIEFVDSRTSEPKSVGDNILEGCN